MKVILKETISSLGIIGSEVDVAPGYARNYLLPQGKAVPATPQQRKILEQEKAKFELQIAKEKEFAQEMANRLEMVSVTIASKVHEADKLYGSITVRDILDALKKQDVEVEKRMVLLTEPIKTVGTFKVPIRVYQGIKPEITVEVVPEEA
ncbi:50S ribosomal protein L9 [Desulfosarcina ovata]|uniref:Large ribosomal subunit protein bL9 n=2 Tax=Desulfosarcina ovata TaxID=83564 RepID=A0A5K8A315_9BACT|nr:50S ribosomal protein L9 [Desulfosarcina ovata]BBO79440.1 50S ribosomal protein L9 [Desulfosarcina ovata subsp. sediminis]BBO86826.1 50S ribosomal protein L9 [Desulfosarcina ovata subsp. ovata]